MTSDWPELSIDDLKASSKNAIAMGPFGSRIKAENFVGEGVPVIKGGNLNGDFILEHDFDFLTDEKAAELKASNAFRRDIVITHRGTIGQVGIIPDNSKFERYVVSQSQLKVTLDQEKVNPYFVYYFLRSPLGQHRLLVNASQVGVPAIAQASSSVKGIMIPCPEMAVQDRVVEILLNLDHKIELNRQTNQTLEAIAQAIFKSWFVDFEPTRAKIAAKQAGQDPERAAMAAISGKPLAELDNLTPDQQAQLKATAALFPDALVDSELGEIPEGWEVSKLGEIIEFNPRRTLKKGELAPYLDMKNVPTKGHLAEDVYLREMASGTKFINGDTLLARITPCLENGKTAYVDFLDDEQVAWGSTEYIVMRPKDGRPLSLGYLIARLDSFRIQAIQTMTGTSGRQRANAKALSEQVWLNYPLKLLDEFDAYSSRYLRRAKSNGNENKYLEQLRDALLPQLLSGELPVNSSKSG